MTRLKKRLHWIGIAVCCPVALYFLTAPFILDYLELKYWDPASRDCVKTWSWKLYAPARAAVTRDWFGRGAYDFYCYDICRMGLLMPMEVSKDYK